MEQQLDSSEWFTTRMSTLLSMKLLSMVRNGDRSSSFLSFYIPEQRAFSVDFSYPYYTEPTILVSRAPKIQSQAWVAFAPFNYDVGLSIEIFSGRFPNSFLFRFGWFFSWLWFALVQSFIISIKSTSIMSNLLRNLSKNILSKPSESFRIKTHNSKLLRLKENSLLVLGSFSVSFIKVTIFDLT